MNIGSDILKERDKINETTAMAHETTLLNPRFYTTNFKITTNYYYFEFYRKLYLS